MLCPGVEVENREMKLYTQFISELINSKVFGFFYSQAAEMVIKESVEPLLEDYRPAGITSLKFSKLSLGTVAPKIEGMHHELV